MDIVRIYALLLVIFVMIGLVCVKTALADNDLHDKDALMAEADGCAGCHRAHTASGPKLLTNGAPQEQFCITCHDGSGAETDVVNGELDGSSYGTLGDGLKGGGFDFVVMDPDLSGIPSSQAVTSSHVIDNSLQRAWGGGSISGTPDYGNMLTLECGDCHNPHGNGNYRILRGNPDGMVNEMTASAIDVPDASPIIYTVTYNTGNGTSQYYRDTSYVPNNLDEWCAQCHTRYSAGTGAGNTDSGDSVFAYRHNTGSLSGGCLKCHVAHGTSATMGTYSGAVTLPDGTPGGGENDSRLLTNNNRIVCVPCHVNSEGQISGHGGDGDCASCHGTTGSHATHTTGSSKGPATSLECSDCHAEDNYSEFADGEGLTNTEACDDCHSPGGAFNGVQIAKANWGSDVYQAGGAELNSGKEQWCASCHDSESAYSGQMYIEPVIVDNPEATYECAWSISTWAPEQFWGIDVNYIAAQGTGSCTATWVPDLPVAGNYTVYTRWTEHTSRSSSVPYTINYASDSETVWVNQKENGGEWYELGTFTFAEGTSGSIVLSDNTPDGTWIIADAVKLVNYDYLGVFAPNVVGDNESYGYYITGHKVSCTSCHDARKTHIDHEHRTYDVDEDTGEVVNPYCDSYRLRDINGSPSMIVPRFSGDAISSWENFALCFDCHNRNEVLGETNGDVSHTNFWNYDSSIANSHQIHLSIGSTHFDSDWDTDVVNSVNRVDSQESCIACHNVHGSPSYVMIRHGELISSYNHTVATVTWTTPVSLTAGDYYVYARWVEYSNRASSARYTINHNGGTDTVYKDQRSQGGEWVLLGSYNFDAGASGSVVLDNELADGWLIADAIGWDSDGVFDPDPEIIVDNPDAVKGGDHWPIGTWSTEFYGADYYYHAEMLDKMPGLKFSYLVPSTGPFATATWTGNITQADDYDVYAWWTQHSNRTSSAQYTINYNGGSDDVYVDQRTNGSQWNLLGNYNFGNGTAGNVTLSNEGADGYVMADAIGWDIDSDGNPDIIVDNSDAGFEYDGGWTCTSSGSTGAYNETICYIYRPSAVVDFDATLDESAGGRFNYENGQVTVNGVCGACHSGVSYEREPYLSPRVLITQAEPATVDNDGEDETLLSAYVYDPGGTVSSVTIDLLPIDGSATQTMYDDGTNGDVTSGDNVYSYLTTVPVTVDEGLWTLTITATDGGSLTGDGEVELLVANPGWYVVDNVDADFVGLWSVSDGGDRYDKDIKYHASGDGSSTASFTPSLSQAGNYKVYAWWTQNTNRATDAPYTITYSGGSYTERVNQRENGSKFVSLGTYYFDAQDGYTEVIVDSADAEYVGSWSTSSSSIHRYGPDLSYLPAGSGANTATFTPTLPQAGSYNVYAWWTQHNNRASNAPYTIYYSGGNETVLTSQKDGGGGWTYLGTYDFDAGTDGYAVFSDDADGYVIADAMKWQLSAVKQDVVLSDDANGYFMADAIMWEPVP
ncbi:MAG: cytochrome c3 family protein [Chloroflexota bacterium]|nr:cytochrome c3 family protein [Chloroflexota bacterium]